jgi:hypothetical protein
MIFSQNNTFRKENFQKGYLISYFTKIIICHPLESSICCLATSPYGPSKKQLEDFFYLLGGQGRTSLQIRKVIDFL